MAKLNNFRPTFDSPMGSPSKHLGHPQHNQYVLPHNLAERIVPSIPVPFFITDEVKTPTDHVTSPINSLMFRLDRVRGIPGKIIRGYTVNSTGSVGTLPSNSYQGSNPGATVHIGVRSLRHPLNGGY